MIVKEELDFEINFYEDLLKKNPGFVNALIALGDAYTKAGRYKDGLRIDQRLVKLRPNYSMVYYNLACSYSLLKMADPCLKAIKKAICFGFSDFGYMGKDPDLKFIRQDSRYKRLILECSKEGV